MHIKWRTYTSEADASVSLWGALFIQRKILEREFLSELHLDKEDVVVKGIVVL